MEQITKRQKEVLQLIYNLTQGGLPPTFAELRQGLGVSSNQTVKDFINALSNKGYVKQERRKARAIKLSRKALEEIYENNKEIKFNPDYNFITAQSLNNLSSDGGSSSSSLENYQEENNIKLVFN